MSDLHARIRDLEEQVKDLRRQIGNRIVRPARDLRGSAAAMVQVTGNGATPGLYTGTVSLGNGGPTLTFSETTPAVILNLDEIGNVSDSHWIKADTPGAGTVVGSTEDGEMIVAIPCGAYRTASPLLINGTIRTSASTEVLDGTTWQREVDDCPVSIKIVTAVWINSGTMYVHYRKFFFDAGGNLQHIGGESDYDPAYLRATFTV